MAEVPGRAIVVWSWATVALFGVVAIPAALGVDGLTGPALAIELLLFTLSLFIWGWAFATAVVRSSQGDDVVVGNLFGSVGGAPAAVKWHLFGALAVSIAIAAGTAAADPFGTLVPMLPLGFIGLWAARHGEFPARKDAVRRSPGR
jgi:hypothetical protein